MGLFTGFCRKAADAEENSGPILEIENRKRSEAVFEAAGRFTRTV